MPISQLEKLVQNEQFGATRIYAERLNDFPTYFVSFLIFHVFSSYHFRIKNLTDKST